MASSCSTVEHMHRVAFYRVGTKIIESIWSTPLQPQLLITFLAHPIVIFPASNVRTTTGRVLTHELHQIRRTVLLVIRRRWPFRFKIRSIIFFCFSFLLLFFHLLVSTSIVFCLFSFFVPWVDWVEWRSWHRDLSSAMANRGTLWSRENRGRRQHVRDIRSSSCVHDSSFIFATCRQRSFFLPAAVLGIRSLSRLRAYACPPYALTRVPFTSPVSPFQELRKREGAERQCCAPYYIGDVKSYYVEQADVTTFCDAFKKRRIDHLMDTFSFRLPCQWTRSCPR